MKNLLFVLGLSISGMALANSTITLRCDHSSADNWPLGGKANIHLTVEVSDDGKILSALLDDKKVAVSAEGNSIIEASPYISRNNGKTYYNFNEQNLNQVRLGDVIDVEVVGTDYLAYFAEPVQCMRTR